MAESSVNYLSLWKMMKEEYSKTDENTRAAALLLKFNRRDDSLVKT